MLTLNKENYSGRDRAKKLKMSLCSVQVILKKDKEREISQDLFLRHLQLQESIGTYLFRCHLKTGEQVKTFERGL